MKIDIGWFVALSLFTSAYIVIDVFIVILQQRYIKNLKHLSKIWGDCAYLQGYLDANDGKPPIPKDQDQFIAELEEKNK